MESTTQEKKESAPTEAPIVEQKPSEVKEEYKDLGEYEARITPAIVDKKNVPVASYGHRMRIAKLYDSHEEFMYKIITVAGWAKTVRSGGKDFCFIEISDGSSFKGLQVMTKFSY